MKRIAANYFADLPVAPKQDIQLLQPDHAFVCAQLDGVVDPERLARAHRDEQDLSFIAALVYGHVRGGFEYIRDRVKSLPREAWWEIADAYYGTRRTRRDRPERGIEFGYPHSFDLVTEWAVYKDLMRHRMGTIQIQAMVPDLGFEMPPEIEEAGLLEPAKTAVDEAEQLFDYLSKQHPRTREYAMLQGHKVRWLLAMNDRALMHMVELRTAPQGHPNYRRTCQQLHHQLAQRFPQRAARMNFVNYDEIYWSRGDSEAAQRRKERNLDEDE
jgi:hypothetical protein